MTSVDLAHLRNVVLAGHAARARRRSASTCCTPPAPSPAWAGWMTAPPASTSSPRSRSASSRCRWRSPRFDHDGHRITIDRHARLRRLRGRGRRGLRGGRCGAHLHGRLGRRRGRHRDGHRARPRGCARPALFVHHPLRARERRPDGAPLDALRAEFGTKIAPLQLAIGKARSFQRLRRPRASQGLAVSRTASAREVPIPDELAAEVARRRDQLLEAAAEADDDVLTKYLEGEEISDAELEACLHKGVRESDPGAGHGQLARTATSASRTCSTPSSATCPRPTRSRPTSAQDGKGAAVEVAPDRGRPAAGPRLQDDRRPLRRPPLLLPRLVGRAQDHTTTSGTPSRARRSASARSCCCTARSRSRSPSSARARSAPCAKLVAHAHRRHARRPRSARSDCRAIVFPRADAAGRHRAADQGRPGQAGRRASPACSRRTRPSASSGQPETGEQVLWAQGENQVAVTVERLKRKFGAAVRDPPAAHPLPRDDPRHDQGRGPPQEADRRPRPVRPRLAGASSPTRAAASSSPSTSSAARCPSGFFPGVEKGVREVA